MKFTFGKARSTRVFYNEQENIVSKVTGSIKCHPGAIYIGDSGHITQPS
jgi:hypothetical protein